MITPDETARAPELSVEKWFNSPVDLTLEAMRGRPVLIHAFQMLCPGCVAHAIPQARKAQELFAQSDLQVIGLHSVFEHHDAMTPIALEAFLHEYRISFPVGVDAHAPGSDIPATMAAYRMRGTPTTLLIDRAGNLVATLFGQVEDMALGSMIQSLLDRGLPMNEAGVLKDTSDKDERCDDEGCGIT